MYSLNNISLADYGILPGRAPGSNIALEGFLDMPKRLGKTFHDWLGEEGIEPYVAADELFFDSRTLSFYGYIKGANKVDCIEKLQELYTSIARLNTLVTLGTQWGDFEVYLKDRIVVDYLKEGYAAIKMVFEQPLITIQNRELPAANSVATYNIDRIPFSAFSCFVTKLNGNYDRPELKESFYTSYNAPGYQLTQVGPLEVTMELYFTAPDFLTLKANIELWHQMLTAPGVRNLNIDGTERDCFAVDGFTVNQVRVVTGNCMARLRVKLLLAFAGKPVITPYLIEPKGIQPIATEQGEFIIFNNLEEFTLLDHKGNVITDSGDSPIKVP
ncbi:hypothetical protein [Croceivirga sp. JEA036]|uniref:hypothetical protein n=1 Tax=Croceivirga sp. JEA036 TaxID=2721162 RepID=UPI00143A6AF9|nr:hypothetical protein [Croceivirga sp. JEA036]NJB36392.1 hypothetical protein [Croceivirga sp. JEA036]